MEPCGGGECADDFAACGWDADDSCVLEVVSEGLEERVAAGALFDEDVVGLVLVDESACGVEECGVFEAVSFGVEEVGVVAVVAPDGEGGVVGFVGGGLCGVDADESQGEFWEGVVAHIEESAVEEVAFFGDGALVVEGVEEGVADFVSDFVEGFCGNRDCQRGSPICLPSGSFSDASAGRMMGCQLGLWMSSPARSFMWRRCWMTIMFRLPCRREYRVLLNHVLTCCRMRGEMASAKLR